MPNSFSFCLLAIGPLGTTSSSELTSTIVLEIGQRMSKGLRTASLSFETKSDLEYNFVVG